MNLSNTDFKYVLKSQFLNKHYLTKKKMRYEVLKEKKKKSKERRANRIINPR